jgi:hypothetical protein
MRLVLMMQTSPQEEVISAQATLLLVHARAMAQRRLGCQVSNTIPLRPPPPLSPRANFLPPPPPPPVFIGGIPALDATLQNLLVCQNPLR